MPQQIFQRLITPAIFVAGGIAAMIYGAQFHAFEVMGEKEVQDAQQPPDKQESSDTQVGGMSGSSAWGVDSTAKKPADVVPPATRIALISKTEFEPSLLRELTVGGVTLKTGQLWRTYRGDSPLLCPT